MRPAKPACRRYFSGRPAVLVTSFDCPTIATERGERSAWRSDVNSPSLQTAAPHPGHKSSFCRFGLALGGPLVEAAVEDVLGDAVFQDFDRAARDHPAAAAPHAVFDQRLAA